MVLLDNQNMKARCYPIDQLLGLKETLPVIACLINNINKHPDIGQYLHSCSIHHCAITKTDESVATLFTLPEQAFRNPHTYCCLTSGLSKLRKYTRSEGTTRRGESSSSSSQSIRSQGSWCLRQHPNFESRRTFDNQSQPHSAPTSVALHQAENFRRFYRAVVSPTHVRVTAGGRIVPNTRAMAPPSFEPNGDKRLPESPQQVNDTEQIDRIRAASSTAGDSQASAITVSAQGPPVFNSVIPGPFLPPYGYLPQGVASMPGQQFGLQGHAQLPHHVVNGNESSSNTLHPVRVSHPGQFDPTRPYMMVNNQMCLPGSAFPQPPNGFPSGLVGNPPFGPPVLSGTPAHHISHSMHGAIPFTMPPVKFPIPMMQHPNGQLFPMIPHQGQTQQAQMAPILPLQLTSTEQTLQQHRDHLMMLEDHIARQSLQSVPYWANQRQVLQGEIARMAHQLQSANRMSRSSQNEQASSQTSTNAGGSLDTLSITNEARSPVIASSNASTTILSQEPAVAYTSSATHTTQKCHSPVINQATSAKPGPGSRLPATAAMAPPFQPRGCRLDLSAAEWEEFAQVTDPRPGGRTSPPATPENTAQRLARLMGNCQTRWEDSAAGSTMISMPRSQTMPVSQFQTHAASMPSFRRSDTHPNSVVQIAQTSRGPVMNPGSSVVHSYGRAHAQNYDPERFLAQKEYFGNSANNLSHHVSTSQTPRFDAGKHAPVQNQSARGNYINQAAFTTDDYLNKCQSMFLPVSSESGATKYASPWSSPIRNSVSHNALDIRARASGPMQPFNLTTQSLATESATNFPGRLPSSIAESPQESSADTEGLELLANVFAATPQKYVDSENQSRSFQRSQRDTSTVSRDSSAQRLEESGPLSHDDLGDIFASEDHDERTQAAIAPMIHQHTPDDLAVIFATEGSVSPESKQVAKAASGGLLTHNDLGEIFAAKESDSSASPREIHQTPTHFNNCRHTSEDLGSIFSMKEPQGSASKQLTKPASTPLLTHEDLGDIFACDNPPVSTFYQIEQASDGVKAHDAANSAGVFANQSPIKSKAGTVTPTYLNGDDVDDNKSIGSWTGRTEHRASTSTQSANEKENLIFTPTTQDGSPKSKTSFSERLRNTSRYVELGFLKALSILANCL